MLTDKEVFDRKYSTNGLFEKLGSTINKIAVADNLFILKDLYPGMNVEKITSRKNEYSLRVNKKYRLHFNAKDKTNFIEIIEINIFALTPHEY